MIRRRAAIIGSLAALFAPAIIRTPGLLMPVKPVVFTSPATWLVQWGEVASYAEWPAGMTVKRVAEYHYLEEPATIRIKLPEGWEPPQWLATGKGYAEGDLITVT